MPDRTKKPAGNARNMLRTISMLGLCMPLLAADNPSPAEINKTLGIPLFTEAQLWEEGGAQVARRLHLTPLSATDAERIYGRTQARAMGETVAEIRLLTDRKGYVRAVEINAVNKGDFFNPRQLARHAEKRYGEDKDRAAQQAADPSAGFLRQLQRVFEQNCEDWTRTIGKALTRTLGKPQRDTLKRAKRQRVWRWNWRKSAFLLDTRKKEFVMLRILPQSLADEGAKAESTSDADIKGIIAERVVREPNGDLWLQEIPMVDQGLKGYCAVATAERVLRYYGITVDSHELAQTAQTDRLGGTSWSDMMQAIKRIAARNRRSFRAVGSDTSARTVERYLEKGIPVIWGMYVTEPIEEAAEKRLRDRPDTSPEKWRKRLKSEWRETRRVEPDRDGGHVRLIVGCNRKTREIAYSDSWGRDTVYWISEKEAQLVSFRGTCLIAVIP